MNRKKMSRHSFWAMFGFTMMGLGMLVAALALVYPIFVIWPVFEFETHLPHLSVWHSILVALGGFGIAIVGGRICEWANKRGKEEGEDDRRH